MKNLDTMLKKTMRFIVYMVLCTVVFSSCKKDKELVPEPEEPATPDGTRAQLTADSIFLYAKEVYLWNTALPSFEGFNPRQYVSTRDEEAGFNSELYAITRYGINSGTGEPFEYNEENPDAPKYSYIFDTDDANPIAYVIPAKSSVDLEGNGFDFGFLANPFGTNANYRLYVTTVYKGSPADRAGIKRGDIFTVVNNRQVTTNFTNETADFLNEALFDASSVSLKVLKASSGATADITLTRTSYRSDPVYKDTVYTAGAKKIGYLAYARFSNLDNSQAALNEAFNDFASKGVTDLIVDLRYNGGGYVQTAEYLADLIAPASKNGQVMYKEHFNTLLQEGKASILKNQPLPGADGKPQSSGATYADVDFSVAKNTYRFNKKGPLTSLQNVVFIVTGSTASASELVINSLKPHMNVKIVGEKSYGKPVGFFPITIDKYEVYFSMFESRNSEDQGGYYAGLTPDLFTDDDVTHDFGDLRESSVKAAYDYLTTGVLALSSAKQSAISSANGRAAKVSQLKGFKPAREEFKGMIETRIKLR